jgi:PH domain
MLTQSSVEFQQGEVIKLTALSRAAAIDDSQKKRRSIFRVMPDGKRSFLIITKNPAEMNIWIDAIRKASEMGE